jgi:hypothetical protein
MERLEASECPVTCLEAVVEAVAAGNRCRSDIISAATRAARVQPSTVSAELSTLVNSGVLFRPRRGEYAFTPEVARQIGR